MNKAWGKAAKAFSSLAVVSVLSGPALAPQTAWALFGLGQPSGSVATAKDHIAKKEWRSATIELKNALEANPDNVEARLLLGDVYLKTYNGPSAEKEFRAARQRGAKDSDITLRLARSYELQRKYDNILSDLHADKLPAPQMPEAYIVRGNAYLGLKRIDEAVASYQKAQQIAPESAEAATGLARVYLLQNQQDKAMPVIEKALKLDPRNVDALLIRAEMARVANNYPEALKYLSAAVDAAPSYLPALMGRASALVELGKLQEAQADLARLDHLAPNHPTVHYLRARIKWQQKDVKGADDELQKTGTALDNFLPAVFLKGLVDFSLNHLEQAAFNLSRVVEHAPEHDGARRVLAMTLLRQGEAAKAIRILQPLVDAKKADSKIYSMMGYANMKLGKLDDSAKYFDLAVQAEPKDSSNRTRQAVSRMALGQYDTAIKTLEGVVKEDPTSLQASVILVMAEIRKGDFKAALAAADSLQKNFPKSPAGAYLKGETLLGQNKLPEARKAYEQAQAISPDNVAPTMRLAIIDIKEGHSDVAAKRYVGILATKPNYVPAMMALAQYAEELRDIPTAIAWLEKAAPLANGDMTPGMRLTELYTMRGEREKALAAANTLAQAHPQEPVVFEALGKVQAAFGDKMGSVATFERLTNMVPQNPGAFHLRARAEIAAGQADTARTTLRTALDLAPKGGKIEADAGRMGTPFTILLDMIQLEIADKKLPQALAISSDIDKDYPSSNAGDITRGNIYLGQNKFPEALAAYQRAEARGKLDTALVIAYYRVYRAQGNQKKAVSSLENWLKTNKNDVQVRTVLGSAYLEAGQYDAAIPLYEGLVQSYPANAQYLNNLAWIYQQKGNPKALDLARRAYVAAPGSFAIMDTYGWLLVGQNKVDQALPLLQKAAFATPPIPDARYHYAVALKASGNKAEARKMLQALVASGASFSDYEAARKLLADLVR